MTKQTISLNPYAIALTMAGLTGLVLINKGGGSYFFEIGHNLLILFCFYGLILIYVVHKTFSNQKKQKD